jgi:A/G-specific adenine glycosylase
MRLAAKPRGKKRENSRLAAGRPEQRGQRGQLGTPQAADLLAWYDRHRRALPWRALPGEWTDPYRVWLSETMLQQTTVKAVAPYYARFLRRWPDLHALAAAALDEVLAAWAGLGYYARARNLHACARAVMERYGGKFPPSETALRELPGIGAYTAAAIAAIAFDQAATPVDGNIERVIARLYALEAPLPAGKVEIARHARALTPSHRPGDFAQALMDLGATICTPKKPACALCPWNSNCAAHARGEAELFPRQSAKARFAVAPPSSPAGRMIACLYARVPRAAFSAAWPKCRRRRGLLILTKPKRSSMRLGLAIRRKTSRGKKRPA